MRNDRGSALLTDALVSMLIGSILLSGMLGVMWLSVKLVHTAPPDHNPTVYGTLISGTARLEDSLVPPLGCDNPSSATTRSDCLTVESDPISPVPDPVPSTDRLAIGDEASCWVVNNDRADTTDNKDKRRLECWQLLNSGYLYAWVHDPDLDPRTDVLDDTSDLLTVPRNVWKLESNPELSRSVASGLVAVKWEHKPAEDAVEFLSCASIKPEQRNLMEPGFVPFCDGTTGVVLSDGSYRGLDDPNVRVDPDNWGTIEGYQLPIIRLEL